MSKEIDDPLKELSEITKPDSRQHFFNTTLDLNHEELTSIQLHSGVPKEVRQLFETAKISLYTPSMSIAFIRCLNSLSLLL